MYVAQESVNFVEKIKFKKIKEGGLKDVKIISKFSNRDNMQITKIK